LLGHARLPEEIRHVRKGNEIIAPHSGEITLAELVLVTIEVAGE